MSPPAPAPLQPGFTFLTPVVGREEFVAPEKMDFRIRKGSPVGKTGFQPIPLERIGLRKDRLRRDLEKRRAGKG